MGTERQRELRRRRSRRKKLNTLKRKAETASVSLKAEIAHKIRALTPGAHVLIDRMNLEER
ncbi:MAG: DUF6800 family protein [Pirellulaceae bacterium]